MNVRIDGPDQISENGSASSTWPFQPVPSPCTNPCQAAAACAQRHARPQDAAHVLHRGRRDVVGELHALDLLRGLERARRDEQRRRVLGAGKRVEPGAAERRRLADHAVGGLRAAAQLDRDAPVVAARPRAASS